MRKRLSGSTSESLTPPRRARTDGGMSDGSRSWLNVGMTMPRSRHRLAVLRITSGCSCLMIVDMSVLCQPPERGRVVFYPRHEDHCAGKKLHRSEEHTSELQSPCN